VEKNCWTDQDTPRVVESIEAEAEAEAEAEEEEEEEEEKGTWISDLKEKLGVNPRSVSMC
jgi:hypothetical protein